MNHLTLHSLGDWACFRSNNSTFISCIKSGIIPTSYRKYDLESQCWMVHLDKLLDLVGLASKFYAVDWSKLPPDWQEIIAGGSVSSKPRRRPARKPSPYAKLHLLDSAPKVLVKVVYEALLLQHHPDHNGGVGDHGKLNEVIAAYREIVSTFDD